MMGRLVYAAHQPDLLPYSGFWYKMHHADVFDLKVWDQYVTRGYQRRVKMSDFWVSLPIVKGNVTDPIITTKMKPGAQKFLADSIVTRYTTSVKKPPLWDKYGPMICEEITSIDTLDLWDFNFRLILLVRDILGIETPLTFSRPAREGLRGSEGLISVMQAFPAPLAYLSGTGARAYMGDCAEFKAQDIPVIWSKHKHVTGDSILTVLFHYEDPLSVVLAEHENNEGEQ